jgi:hypothetical protein
MYRFPLNDIDDHAAFTMYWKIPFGNINTVANQDLMRIEFHVKAAVAARWPGTVRKRLFGGRGSYCVNVRQSNGASTIALLDTSTLSSRN